MTYASLVSIVLAALGAGAEDRTLAGRFVVPLFTCPSIPLCATSGAGAESKRIEAQPMRKGSSAAFEGNLMLRRTEG